jgi:hypothetical protein
MRRTKLLLATAALALGAQAANAQSCSARSGDEIIAACDAAFIGDGIISLSARGWCYLLNATCVLS